MAQVVRPVHVVAVDRGGERRLEQGHGAVSGRGYPDVVEMDHPDPAIPPGMGPADLQRPVLGAVVDDQQDVVFVGLPRHALEKARQVLRNII